MKKQNENKQPENKPTTISATLENVLQSGKATPEKLMAQLSQLKQARMIYKRELNANIRFNDNPKNAKSAKRRTAPLEKAIATLNALIDRFDAQLKAANCERKTDILANVALNAALNATDDRFNLDNL